MIFAMFVTDLRVPLLVNTGADFALEKAVQAQVRLKLKALLRWLACSTFMVLLLWPQRHKRS